MPSLSALFSKSTLSVVPLLLLASPMPPPPRLSYAPIAEAPVEAVKAVQRPALGSPAPEPHKPGVGDFPVESVLALEAPVGEGQYVWNDEGAPDAPLRIVVDLRARLLFAYRGGVEIGRSSLIYGADNMPTPTGIFPILQKDAKHVSNLYDAPMPYMLRLTNDGITIHASEVAIDVATHGCIGIPKAFAKTLFANAKLGDLVLVTEQWLPQVYVTPEPGKPFPARIPAPYDRQAIA
jgi:L,D-transpeptidase catalytic domain